MTQISGKQCDLTKWKTDAWQGDALVLGPGKSDSELEKQTRNYVGWHTAPTYP